MEIVFARSPFVQPVTDLLRELDRIGFFAHSLLIGSWPMSIYAERKDGFAEWQLLDDHVQPSAPS
ncbi:MAG: hypothetical protein GJT30_07100 [Geobacter sp.]|nr:hypothetical protein [Geobacter sp.]